MQSQRQGILLRPTGKGFDAEGVCNPGCVQVGTTTHMVYRGVSKDNYSAIGYCQIENGVVTYRHSEPILAPERAYERHGVEDPRLVILDGTYHLFYVAYDGTDTCVCLATGPDLFHLKRQGIISPLLDCADYNNLIHAVSTAGSEAVFTLNCVYPTDPSRTLIWDKDGLAFPRRIDGKVAFIHRLKPSIQLTLVKEFDTLTRFDSWVSHPTLTTHTLLEPRYSFETYVGGGCPPIETQAGWLLIYHAVEICKNGPIYRAAAALLDLHNPLKVLSRLPYPLFEPTEKWELQGTVNNVVFPTGATLEDDTLSIYYGAADTVVAWCTLSLSELLAELQLHRELVVSY